MSNEPVVEESVFVEDNKRLVKFEVRNDHGWVMGCKKGAKLFIWACSSDQKGAFRMCMDFLCNHYHVNRVEFTNVISEDLVNAIHHFKYKRRFWKVAGEYIENMEGKWKARK